MAKKLQPKLVEYIWGGEKLRTEFNKDFDGNRVGESWELSFAKGYESKIDGKNIDEALTSADIGKNADGFPFFPSLIKFIDASDDLSIQVHPSDDYALKNEGQYGKTEMWYILSADEGAGIYFGFKKQPPKDKLKELMDSGEICDYLNFYHVKAGETYFVRSGTVHAIGKGVVIYEIQQNSTLTYRLYDYKRVDKNGKQRELHTEKAAKVLDTSVFTNNSRSYKEERGESYVKTPLGVSKYFSCFAINLSGNAQFSKSNGTFNVLSVVEGECEINGIASKKGDSVFISAGEEINLSGNGKLILAKLSTFHVGIDLGGTFIKGGVVTDDGEILVETSVPTEADKGYRRVEENIAGLIKSLCDSCNLSLSEISSFGMGVPGMIDSDDGTVIYSNNLKWDMVHITEDIKKIIGVELKITNDANAAVLGEVLFGGAKGKKDVVMLTLGTGLGGGIVIGGKIFEGGKGVGAELGHTIYERGGEQCTCGRKGCFEAYVSATALIRDTKRALEKNPNSAMWMAISSLDDVNAKLPFDYEKVDDTAVTLVKNYVRYLSDACIDFANVFRPEAILVGGGVSKQGENLTLRLQDTLDKEIFGGSDYSRVEIKTAKLGNLAGLMGAAFLE